MIYSIGFDVSKDKFDTCLQRYDLTQQTSSVIARKEFSNTQSGFTACMDWVQSHTRPTIPVRATMEATGVYYEPLALFLHRQQPSVHLAVVVPSQSEKFIQSRGLRSKTDKMDAYGLALMGAERRLGSWGGINPFWRQLQAMTRTRAGLMEQRTTLRNQLHALNHGGMEAQEAKGALQAAIQALTKEIDQLTSSIYKKLRSRKQLQQSIDYLKTIPGVGRLTIAAVLAETKGFKAFKSISQLISFSGYDVVIRQSGKWQGKSTISKQGSSHIRRAMYMPATTAVRQGKGPIGAFYRRLVDKHDVKMKAHVGVQKKLLRYMYVLWNKQESFDPDHIRRQQDYHNNVAPPEGEATVDPSQATA